MSNLTSEITLYKSTVQNNFWHFSNEKKCNSFALIIKSLESENTIEKDWSVWCTRSYFKAIKQTKLYS